MRVGIIGAGGIAQLHQRSYAALDGVKIVGVADPSAAARERAEKEWGVPAYETVEELLEKAKPDAVSICSPPKFHAEAAVKCLNAGVAVLCEKPMARTVAEAEQIQAAAKSSGVPLMLAFCHRYHPPVVAAKKAIDSGELGEIRMVRNRFGGFQDMTPTWFANPDVAGGGTVLDTSIHSIDLFHFLAGEVAWVDAATAAFGPGYQVEDSAVLLLGTKNGALGVIEGSWSTPGSQNVIEIYGSNGAVMINYNTGEATILKKGSGWEKLEDEGGPDRFAVEVEKFIQAVRDKTPTPITAEDGVLANKVAAAAYTSAREGRRVPIE